MNIQKSLSTAKNGVAVLAASALLASSCLAVQAVTPTEALAKSNTVTYEANRAGWGYQTCVKSMKIKGSKLVIKGKIEKVAKCKSTVLKSKTRTFKLTSKTKYYDCGDGASATRISKKKFTKLFKKSAYSIQFTVKNGKVKKAYVFD